MCTGPIPECLGALTNLTDLHLSENQLTGKVPDPVFVAYVVFTRLVSGACSGPLVGRLLELSGAG